VFVVRRVAKKAVLSAATGVFAIAVLAAAAAAGLQEGRRYELVSPPSKNGVDIIPHSNKTRSAVDGDAVVFNALGGFGDVRGTSVDVEYLSRRDALPGTSGWSTHAITPRGASITFEALILGNLPTFAGFAPDLSGAVYRSWRPLTDAPNADGVSNLYKVESLLEGEPSVRLLSDALSPLADLDPPFLRMVVHTTFAAASEDMRHVIFESPWNLLGDGAFGFFSGKLYEYAEGSGVRLVGRVPAAGDTACDDVRGPLCVAADTSQAGISPSLPSIFYSTRMISEDGSRIAFQVPSGGAPAGAIYLRVNGTTTLQINASEKTSPESPADAQVWDMSSDGRRVFFTTSEGLVDGDDAGNVDLYMYDAAAPDGAHLTRLSLATSGRAYSVRDVVGASDDGHFVYFVSDGQLVAGEPDNEFPGLYLWHDGDLAYIGRFGGGDTLGINTPRTQWIFITQARTSRVSADGRHLLFMTRSDAGFRGRGGFAGYDHGSTCTYDDFGSCRELYLYSADTGRLVCVSCNPTANVATGDAITDVRVGTSASGPTQHLSRALSADAKRVFFSTPESLVTEDSNGKWDAYEYDVPSASLHLISTGKSSADSYFLDASESGDDVFFVTRERLVGWDVDDNYDLYDARVNGGFPDPAPPALVCSGDACRASADGPPAADAAASAQVRRAGDVVRRLRKHRRCRGRAVLRRVRGKRRCVHRRSRRAQMRGERSSK